MKRLVSLVLLFAFMLAVSTCGGAIASSVVREAPATCLPGFAFSVTNRVNAAEGVAVYAVEEELPAGWAATQISHNGRFDAAHRKVKWGPFFDRSPRVLTYRAAPPAGAAGVAVFAGQGVFDDVAVPITGALQTEVLSASTANQVISSFPAYFIPGVPFTVTNSALSALNVNVYAIEDQPPSGWTVGAVSDGGQWDITHRKVKWGPFFDNVARVLTYQVTPPNPSAAMVVFSGVGSFDGASTTIVGQRESLAVTSTVISSAPDMFQPTIALSVVLTVTPAAGVGVYAVEEQIPPDWTVSTITEGGAFDPANRIVKWGPFFDAAPRVLTYQLTPPATVTGVITLAGRGAFDGIDVPISGQRQLTAVTSRVVSELPLEFLPGVTFGVTNTVTPDETVGVYAVEDEVPAGWSVSAISHAGAFDTVNRKVKWGPFFDHQTRVLSYQVTPPGNAAGVASFEGNGSFDGLKLALTGQRQTMALSIAQANSVTRGLPANVRAGLSITVSHTVVLAANTAVYAVEDQAPAGWEVSAISDGGTFDAANRKVKWGPFFDNVPRVLTYQLSVPVSAAGETMLDGAGSFDGVRVNTGGAASLLVIANHAPVARNDAVQREAGQALSIPDTRLLSNDTDADQDALIVTNLPALSANGAALTLTNGAVLYEAPAGFNGEDSFNYSVSDGFGGVASALVSVSVLPARPSLNIRSITQTNGIVRVRFQGIPAATYLVQATESLSAPNWVTLGSRVADARGEFEFVDADAPNHPARFYRSRQP